jgi:hypothetical protein
MEKDKKKGRILSFKSEGRKRKKQNQGGVVKINLKEKFNQLYKKKG